VQEVAKGHKEAKQLQLLFHKNNKENLPQKFVEMVSLQICFKRKGSKKIVAKGGNVVQAEGETGKGTKKKSTNKKARESVEETPKG
jgi:hypothetical protein